MTTAKRCDVMHVNERSDVMPLNLKKICCNGIVKRCGVPHLYERPENMLLKTTCDIMKGTKRCDIRKAGKLPEEMSPHRLYG
jgi:hypothetical protein